MNRVEAEQTPSGQMSDMPILPLPGSVVFPGTVTSVSVKMKNHKALLAGLEDGDLVGLLLQKSPDSQRPRVGDLYRLGTVARVLNCLRINEEIQQIYLYGLERMMVESFNGWEPFISADIQVLRPAEYPMESLAPLTDRVWGSLEQFVSLAPRIPDDTLNLIRLNSHNGGRLADMVAIHIPFELRDRQQVLETTDVEHRLNIILEMVDREIANISVMNEISSLAKEEIEDQQRKMFLRRQLRTIQKELGEDPERKRIEEIKKRVTAMPLPEEVRLRTEKEIERLEAMSSSFSEYTVILNYLDWILELPWGSYSEDNLDLKHARKILDEHHFGLDDVKERILEFLAVRYLKDEVRGPVLCLSGPPGVGKTSLGRAIAESLGRGFVRMSVGGMRDENEIRGHRRTYVGAMPGRIVQNLRQAGCINPVFMIDEIDKMGSDFRGDPSSALLEVLDPEQNSDFMDHYLDIPLDLSRIFFIATANVLPNIPPALKDRLEVIKLPGYTESEKCEIAKRHLMPRQLGASGLTESNLKIDDQAMTSLVRGYTREAGVRNLERQLANICRKTAKEIVAGNKGPHKVDEKALRSLLGPAPFTREAAAAEDAVGVSTALAWSEAGGEILFVEALKIPGSGHIKVTGTIGDVMRESAQAADSYIKANAVELGIEQEMLEKWDVHVHIPEGAVPKDGPSAGLALVSAMASLLSNRPLDHKVAMTGEITLTGRVLPIGGLKEKAIAAHRAGIRKVIVPAGNEANLDDLPTEVREEMEFFCVGRISEALKHLLRQ